MLGLSELAFPAVHEIPETYCALLGCLRSQPVVRGRDDVVLDAHIAIGCRRPKADSRSPKRAASPPSKPSSSIASDEIPVHYALTSPTERWTASGPHGRTQRAILRPPRLVDHVPSEFRQLRVSQAFEGLRRARRLSRRIRFRYASGGSYPASTSLVARCPSPEFLRIYPIVLQQSRRRVRHHRVIEIEDQRENRHSACLSQRSGVWRNTFAFGGSPMLLRLVRESYQCVSSSLPVLRGHLTGRLVRHWEAPLACRRNRSFADAQSSTPGLSASGCGGPGSSRRRGRRARRGRL